LILQQLKHQVQRLRSINTVMDIPVLFGSVGRIQSKIREKSKSKNRSPMWDSVRDEFIALHPVCAACGSRKQLQVHHIMPFHLHPDLELSKDNLIALCMDEYNCHLTIGHGGAFSCYNPDVKEDAVRFQDILSDKKKINALLKEVKLRRRSV